MKILDWITLFDNVGFRFSSDYKQIELEIREAITAVKWPRGSNSFTLYDGHHANGVKPIKDAFVKSLKKNRWQSEAKLKISSKIRPGPLDAVKKLTSDRFAGKLFAVEWETGNISSSHRALNKMVLGMLNESLLGGLLILPSKDMYWRLTDRVGNIVEIEPYFPIWQRKDVNGILQLLVIEHDSLSKKIPKIAKGTDGRALV